MSKDEERNVPSNPTAKEVREMMEQYEGNNLPKILKFWEEAEAERNIEKMEKIMSIFTNIGLSVPPGMTRSYEKIKPKDTPSNDPHQNLSQCHGVLKHIHAVITEDGAFAGRHIGALLPIIEEVLEKTSASE